MQPEFLPPSASLSEPRLKPRSSIVAVLLGGLGVNLLGAISMTLVIAVVSALASRGGDHKLEALLESHTFLIASTAIEGIWAIVAGYVAARWARRRAFAHGVAAGILSVVLVVPFLWTPGALEHPWFTIPVLIAQVPLSALGGHLAGRRLA